MNNETMRSICTAGKGVVLPGTMPALPPLNAVRAFEAAARHVSFSKAAEELHVTRGAVSRQVALLEDWLKRPLFMRTSSQLVLTPAGSSYLLEVSDALRKLAFASEYLDENPITTVLRLHAPPTFTMRWLLTRVSTFRRRYPEIEIRTTVYRPEALVGSNQYDVGIRGSTSPTPGQTSIPFIDERVLPVCHPDLLGDKRRLSPEDLRDHTLIVYTADSYSWPRWLNAVGFPSLRPASYLRFDPMYFGLQAALEGLGIVLIPMFIVLDDLIAGRLCAPFGLLGESRSRQYYVNYLPTSKAAGAITLFSDWLLQEGRDTNRAMEDWASELNVET